MRAWMAGLGILVMLFVAPAAAQVAQPVRPYDPAVVRVAGRAEVYLPPDQARIRVSYYASGRTAADATNEVTARTRVLDAAVRALDSQSVAVERADVSVTPVMREGGDRRPDRINGYEASAGVTILVRDLALLTRTVELAVNAQPDRFDDVAFSLRDTASARRAAREAAIGDAVDKARVYSEGAGYRLGRLLLIEEGASDMIARSSNVAVSTVSPTIAAEPLLYTAEVSVVFEVGPSLTAR